VKYTQKTFDFHVGTKDYRDGWDAIWGKAAEEDEPVPDTEREPVLPLVRVKFRSDGKAVVERKD
jgi:hypothetical protein